jgi:hypothetical protein
MSRTKWALKTAQLLLDHLLQVLDQMEAVGDLAGLWGTNPCSFGMEALAIATDDFDGRARAQPGSSTHKDRSSSTSTTGRRSRSTMMCG